MYRFLRIRCDVGARGLSEIGGAPGMGSVRRKSDGWWVGSRHLRRADLPLAGALQVQLNGLVEPAC